MSPMGKKKCSYSVMKKKGLISPVPAMGDVKKPKYDSFKNEDGTETNISVKRKKVGKRKGEVKSTTESLVAITPSGEKVNLAYIKTKPGKKPKKKGSNKALADLRKSISNKNLAQSSNG